MRLTKMSALLLLAAAAANGCTTESPASPETQNPSAKLGHVDVALLGQGSRGNYYVLRQAIVMVQGPSSTEFYNTEDDPTRQTISSDVPAGSYSVFLQEGWQLQRVVFDTAPSDGHDDHDHDHDHGGGDAGGTSGGGTTGGKGDTGGNTGDEAADAGTSDADGGAGSSGGSTGGTGGPGYTLVPVQARLTSENPQGFEVFIDQRTQVALRFQVGDEVVGMGGGYDIGIEVEENPTTNPNPGYCSTDADCATGETCCLAGFLGQCRTLGDGESCPLPDLTVSQETAASSIYIHHETFPADSCAIAEGCVDAAGDRRLLAFSTQTPNVGEADMILGDPNNVSGFEYSSCHGHYHYEGYAAYQLLDAGGNVVATGHKQAFCLLDSAQVVPGSSSPRYHCGFQGISAGWSDIYGAGLDCQWVDITDVPEGDYVLVITINTDRTLPEANYDNNSATIPVHIGADVPPVPGDVLGTCSPEQGGGTPRDCGWTIPEGMQGLTCAPGSAVNVGCGCDPAAACEGDPVMRICAGDGPCTAAEALTFADDSCGYCPQTSFTCPDSGVYSVLTGAYNPGSAYACLPVAQ